MQIHALARLRAPVAGVLFLPIYAGRVSSTPTIGVLAVQGDVREHVQVLTGLGARAVTVRRPSEVEEVDALVIPGGESTTMDKLVRAFNLYEPLRKRLADGMPAYGSCAGMIMLADRIADGRPDQQTLGGIDITVRRNAFGRQVDSFEEDIHFTGLDGTVRAVFIRAPWIDDHGEAVEVLAEVDGHVVAARQDNMLVISFHPEIAGETRLHELFLAQVRSRAPIP